MIVPPVEAFGTRSVYHIQFPFWVPDRIVKECGGWLAGYDEIWAYSEFVRRNVNGLIRHYGLDARLFVSSRPTPCGPAPPPASPGPSAAPS